MDMAQKERRFIIRTGIFFSVVLCLTIAVFLALRHVQVQENKLTASYTAESTVRKIEMLLNRYLENSELFKSILSSGTSLSEEEFSELAGYMKANKHVIEAYELAPDGGITMVYPIEGNEEALGLDMLQLSERKETASLAKESGEYTIAGPFELKQGGTGALLYDPIYLEQDGKKQFWGFSILVLNWEKFVEELQIDKLEEAGYHFNVWKYDTNGDKVSIMVCSDGTDADAIDVECSVPNDTWHFEIKPCNGWFPIYMTVIGSVMSVFVAGLLTVGYYQYGMRRLREAAYARKIEKAAQEARDANEAKTRFLFNMSHDIRTPMNAIIGYSNLLETNIDNRETALDYIKKIKDSNSMLLSLINHILEMARIESGKSNLKQEKGNLEGLLEILKAVTEPQILQKNLSFAWNLDVKHTGIICDITKVREVVTNIVSNAIKYTPDGGSASLTIRELPADQEGYGNYEFVIEDNGIGMSEEYLPHIFEEFSRERNSTESKIVGAGLGLPIVKALVDLMGGDIKVESRLNVGTKFIVTLSFLLASEEKESESAVSQDEGAKDISGKRLLLVEDNELNAEIAITILEDHGLKVDLAEDGERCMAILSEKPELYYDGILMDIQMPKMNGYETTVAIRNSDSKNAKLPIIAMTANAFEEDREKAMRVGMNGYIAKPINIEKMFSTLNSIL